MGLGSDVLQEVIRLKRARVLARMSRVMEIGAQQLSNDFLRADQELQEIFALFGRQFVPLSTQPIDAGEAAGLELQAQDAPSSGPFWESLGFEYAALDFDGHRHSLPLDLNKDQVPAKLRGRFDLVINAGTTEHVANQDNAFRVMHDLVRFGGVMIHELPAAGMLTHGLVTYTMKFFWHLCRENNYQVLRLEMTPGGASAMPDDIVFSNRTYGRRHNAVEFEPEPIRDWSISATLRKIRRKPYATPLDVPVEVMPRNHFDFVARRIDQVLERLRR